MGLNLVVWWGGCNVLWDRKQRSCTECFSFVLVVVLHLLVSLLVDVSVVWHVIVPNKHLVKKVTSAFLHIESLNANGGLGIFLRPHLSQYQFQPSTPYMLA